MTHIVSTSVTQKLETELDLERKLTAGTYTTVTDGGAGGNIVVDLDTTAADARYVNVPGDTMTGTLLITPAASNMQLKLHPTFAMTETGVTYNAGFFYSSANEPIFNMIRSAAGTTMLGGGVDGDTVRRFAVDVGGGMAWGTGSATRDATFSRTGAGLMTLAAGLIVNNTLSVGTTATTAKLNITQAANTEAGGIILLNSGAARSFRLWVDASNVCRIDSASGGSGDIAFNTTGTGKIGMGTITPAAKLDIVGKADVIQLQVTANGTQTSDLARIGTASSYTAISGTGNIKSVGRRRAVVVKTTDYTATASDEVIVCNKATAMTITLPAATGSGQTYYIKSIGAGAVTIDGAGAETIDGNANQVIYQWEGIDLTDYAAGVWIV